MLHSQETGIGAWVDVMNDAQQVALKIVVLDRQTERRRVVAGILANKFCNAAVQDTDDLELAVNWTFHDVDLVVCALEEQWELEMLFLRRLRSSPRSRDVPVLIFPRRRNGDQEQQLAALGAVVFHGELVDVEDLILSAEALIKRYRKRDVCHTLPRTAPRRKISQSVWVGLPALAVTRQGICVAPPAPLAPGIALICEMGDFFQAVGRRTRDTVRECVSIGSVHGASRPMSLLYPVQPDEQLDRCLEACFQEEDSLLWEFFEQRTIRVQCQLMDLSASGAGLVADIPWAVNALITLNLGPLRSLFPMADIDTDIVCRVARQTRLDRRYGIALQFEQAPAPLIDAILKWSAGGP